MSNASSCGVQHSLVISQVSPRLLLKIHRSIGSRRVTIVGSVCCMRALIALASEEVGSAPVRIAKCSKIISTVSLFAVNLSQHLETLVSKMRISNHHHTCLQPTNHQRGLAAMSIRLSIIALTLSAITAFAEHPQNSKPPTNINRLLLVTIAQRPNNEAFRRFNHSIEAYNHELIVLGADLPQSVSQVDEIDLLRKALSLYKGEKDSVILFVRNENLIINGNKEEILLRFGRKFKPSTRIVFSADNTGQKFTLNPDAFIGYAPSLWDLLNINQKAGASSGSDKWLEYFTKAFANAETRQRLGLELDQKAELFQNLHSIESDVEIEFDTDSVKLKNTAHSTEPVIVHETGPNQVILNSLGNYLGKAWTVRDGCRNCNETSISLATREASGELLPLLLVGLFIEEPTPFFQEFLTSLLELDYPRDRMHLFIHSSVKYHDEQLQNFLNAHGSQYASQQLEKGYSRAEVAAEAEAESEPETESNNKEWVWRDYALEKCKQIQCEYYLSLDSVARLDDPKSVRYLIEANKTIIGPLLSRPTKLWSNFWGSITSDGYYARSHDYVQLVKRERLGIWNVPQLMNAYLIEGSFIRDHLPDDKSSVGWKLSYYEPTLKPILAFSKQLRSKGIFQFMMNTHEFGHLVDPTSFNISRTHPDFYQLKDNVFDWEQRYLHENYSKLIPDLEENDLPGDDDSRALGIANERSGTGENGTSLIEQPCPDVFWFPLVNDLFCKQLIEIMESFGRWSGGTNDDPRIEGGYESVPTRDIHFRQVGLHDMWLLFLREYVMPIQLKEFVGYEHDPPRADLAFVVRYHPAEQASLRPHHDSSTYTLNIALNTPEQDYTGGGCRFVRYNCSVVQSRKGWALLHPGRLTHYHEGLPVTSGTRYIMVTFVDP